MRWHRVWHAHVHLGTSRVVTICAALAPERAQRHLGSLLFFCGCCAYVYATAAMRQVEEATVDNAKFVNADRMIDSTIGFVLSL